jgi:hypothetical protein
MNILRSILVLIISCTISSSLADSGGNSVYIDQTNANNSVVTITQTGSNNKVGDPDSVSAPSFQIDGNTILATIIQDGIDNALTGMIYGGDTLANITQTGNSNSSALNMGSMGTDTGTLNMNITGNTNSTVMNIGSTNNSSNYNYNLTMTGNNNLLTSNINSTFTVDTFSIIGSNNEITTTQIGAGGTSNSDGHSIAISNIGNYNTIEITQDGTTNPNSAILNLSGDNATVSITQH